MRQFICLLNSVPRYRVPTVRTQTRYHSALNPAFLPSLAVKENARLKIAKIDSKSPLVDSFNRRHNYLRISLTEKCNLRCFYCMPKEGIDLSPRENILSNIEVIRLARLFVKSGVTKIRLTGGEPTIRKGIIEILAQLKSMRPFGLEAIGITTNGLALHRRLPEYIENGLTHLNLSLDTLDPLKFELMTRRAGHDAVLRSLEVALASLDLQAVKLNVVVVKGLNDNEILDFVEMTRDRRLSVRFIEYMPFKGNKWNKSKMISSSELLTRIENRHSNIVRTPDDLNDTARSWCVPGYLGSFGFISSMSDHFCASCNRLRITADGQIKVCLFDAKEVSLRDEIRRGASDAELLQIIGRAIRGKQEKHVEMEDIDVSTNRPMILIGDNGSYPTMHLKTTPGSTSYAIPNPELRRHMFSFPRRFNSTHTHRTNPRLTHIDATGRPSMVCVSDKGSTKRVATASGRIYIPAIAYDLVTDNLTQESPTAPASESQSVSKDKARAKGDALTVAQIAAIMGSKRTSDLIPLCHPLQLSHISVQLTPQLPVSIPKCRGRHDERSPNATENLHSILCESTVSCEGNTGVEMEALTAVSVGLLTLWDMLKAVAGREMIIGDITVTHKEGGHSGNFSRPQKMPDTGTR